MTNREFSDSFDTLLNSYDSKAIFGDQAAHTEIVLDEYEKSVLLTQAQDNVIKSYFEKHTNQLGQGFDDSSRRQVDFSSLIKVATLNPDTSNHKDNTFDNRGIIYKLPTVQAEDGKDYSRVLYILNEHLIGYTGTSVKNFIVGEGLTASTRQLINLENNDDGILQIVLNADPTLNATCTSIYNAASDTEYAKLTITIGNNATSNTVMTSIGNAVNSTSHSNLTYSVSGIPAITKAKQLSSTLMPVNFATLDSNQIRYVIIPINYKEYDRMMSKPYANPFKKQAWRIFQNISTGYDIYSELIPIWNVDKDALTYKIRYVERPTPIVLVDLPNNLSVDGYMHEQPCILNPIIHPEILQEAVRLAIQSRASAVSRAEAMNRAAEQQGRG